MDILEFKNHTGEVKDVDLKGKRVSGYFSAFGNVDSDNDIIEKGAYSKTIAERKDQIFFLNQHNWAQPHGKLDELKEDDFGLYFVSKPLLDTTYSMDALKLYEAGIIKEHSVGFLTMKDEIKNNVRYIKEIKLFEGSNVTLGSNPNTPFLGMKSLSIEQIQDETKKFLKAFRTGTFTDETFGLLEVAIKQLQKQAFEIGKNHSEPQLHSEPMQEETKAIYEFLKAS